MKELAIFLLNNIYLDFQGDLDMETVRGMLRKDDSPDARALLSKLIDEKGIDDLLIIVADCLKEHIQSGINSGTVTDTLNMYADA